MDWALSYKKVKVEWANWAKDLREIGLKVAFESCLAQNQPKNAQGWFGAIISAMGFSGAHELPTLDEEVNAVDTCMQQTISQVSFRICSLFSLLGIQETSSFRSVMFLPPRSLSLSSLL